MTAAAAIAGAAAIAVAARMNMQMANDDERTNERTNEGRGSLGGRRHRMISFLSNIEWRKMPVELLY